MIPKVFQDLRNDSRTYGAVAVEFPAGSALGEYGVMTLTTGGSFVPESALSGWTLLIPET